MIRFTAICAAVVVFAFPRPGGADEPYGVGWHDWHYGGSSPARVIALLYNDYQLIDAKHRRTVDGWVVGFSTTSQPRISIDPCNPTEGLHEECTAVIAPLICAKAPNIRRPCSMILGYAYWVSGYDCSLNVAGRIYELHDSGCPEIQADARGKRISPRIEPLPPDAPRAGREVTFQNATSQPIGSISFLWLAANRALEASTWLHDTPLKPGNRITLRAPRSVFGNIPAKDGKDERTLVYVGARCKVDVDVEFEMEFTTKPHDLVTTRLPNVDVCRARVIMIKVR